MELHLNPEITAKLNDMAQRTGRSADELVEEAVSHLAEYNDWLERKVDASRSAVGRGEIVDNEEVGEWLNSRERR